MFNFFKPKLPIDLQNKSWIEYRWQWLGRTFGWDLMRNAPMLTLADFPELKDLSEANARNLFQRICDQYEFTENSVDLEFFEDSDDAKHSYGSSNLGLYHRGNDLYRAKVSISTSLFQRPAEMVKTMAHELAHHLLLGGSGTLLAADEIDHECLTDLVLVFAGFGLFAANCTVQDKSYGDGRLEYFQISKNGYLSSIQFGYTLGLMAWMRSEYSPTWINQLRLDAKVPCKNTIRYLRKTGDTFVDPNSRSQSELRSIDELVSQSPSVRLATLTQWQMEPQPIDQIVGHIVKLIEDRVVEIRISAINLFTDSRIPLNPTSERALIRSLGSNDEQESLFACQALFCCNFTKVTELVYRSRFWFERTNESALARTTYVEILKSLPAKDFLPECQSAIVAKTDRDLQLDGEAATLLLVLRKIPDLDRIINRFFDHWPDERKQGLVHFRDTGIRPAPV